MQRATGPNHELALVMTKERAVVMAKQVYCRSAPSFNEGDGTTEQ
jgi:hypothetical protein